MKRGLIFFICIINSYCIAGQKEHVSNDSILSIKPFYKYGYSDSLTIGYDTIYIERNNIDNFLKIIVRDSVFRQVSPKIRFEELNRYMPYVIENIRISKHRCGFIVKYYYRNQLDSSSYYIFDIFNKNNTNGYYRIKSFFFSGNRYLNSFSKYHDTSVSLSNYYPQNENYVSEEGFIMLCKLLSNNNDDELSQSHCESYNKQIRNAYNRNEMDTMFVLSDILVIQMAISYFFEPISEDIVGYNNSAYYLEQKGFYFSAVYLLKKILEVVPNRTVAYINLGDAYWGLKEIENAKAAYQKYIKLMKANGKENKIPKRILHRINN